MRPTAAAEAAAIAAIAGVGDSARDAYVTLEPVAISPHAALRRRADRRCCARVGRWDPNPLVAGRVWQLAAAASMSPADCWRAKPMNSTSACPRMTRRPWLRLKVAASPDGKTALNNGVSQ